MTKKNKLHFSHLFLLIALFYIQKKTIICVEIMKQLLKLQPNEEPIRIKEHGFLITRLNDSNYDHFLTVFFFQINSIRSDRYFFPFFFKWNNCII